MEEKTILTGKAELRRQAEKAIKESAEKSGDFLGKSQEEIASLIHELHVHQLELEMQNEELRRIQGELEKTQSRYSHLFDFSPMGYFSISEKGIIEEANLTIASMLEVDRSLLIGKPLSSFVLKDDQDIFYINRQRLLETETPQVCELRFVKKDGHEFYTRLECMIINGEREDSREIRAAVSDITESKRAEKDRDNLQAKLIQAQKMESIGNLAGGVAHDFNNILFSVIGFSELAIDEAPKGSNIDNYLQEIYNAGKRARDLVRQILTFARKSNEEVKPVNVAKLANESIRLIRASIPSNIEIEKSINTEARVVGNPSLLEQVFLNLSSNAADAMEDGGKLGIDVSDIAVGERLASDLDLLGPGDYVQITVSDTGIGIPQDSIKSIFEPYYTTKGHGKGTGMGLASAYGTVKKYAGTINVESRLGEGTVFTVLLPVTRRYEISKPGLPEAVLRGKEKILFVDDELPLVKMGSQILEGLGYLVTAQTSSIEALELFRAKPDDFDLVVTDMTMPGMTGDKLAVELMKIRPDIPVILCTGYSKKISDEKASGIGIKAFAYKPMVKAELTNTVRKVLDEAKSENQG